MPGMPLFLPYGPFVSSRPWRAPSRALPLDIALSCGLGGGIRPGCRIDGVDPSILEVPAERADFHPLTRLWKCAPARRKPLPPFGNYLKLVSSAARGVSLWSYGG
jgi:hypothetical protein